MYTALVLSSSSQEALLAACAKQIPAEWEKLAHHLTVNMGPAAKGPAADSVGKVFEVRAMSYAIDNKVIAVLCDTLCPSTNTVKHITVAVNRAGGGKPVDSNKLSNWMPLIEDLHLTGVMQECQ